MNSLVFPDMALLLLGFLVIGVDLFQGGRRAGMSFHLSWAGLAAVFFFLLMLPFDQSAVFLGTYRVSGFGLLFKILFVLSAWFAVLLARPYFSAEGGNRRPLGHEGEFYGLLILATSGMFTVVSATDLLTLFIGMELATIPLYVLSAYRKGDRRSAEASTKYIIMGAFSTGLLLFGYSLLYGFCGSLGFAPLLAAAAAAPQSVLLNLGVLFVFAAIGFKMTLVPFHMWAPDVYEGAPLPVTAFISVSSKATAMAFLIILFYGPLAPLHASLQHAVLLLAGATMTIGNLGALRQKNLLRFMAYSSIAQAGYILLAMAGPAELGKSSILYYIMVYGAANYVVFFLISIIGRDRPEEFASLQGLARQQPALAGILVLTMFSLAGIPPVAGFIGKFMLFAAAAQAGFYFMIIFAALNSTVSLYYYLLVVKEAYIVQPATAPGRLRISMIQKSSLAVLTVAIIALGLMPGISTAIVELAR